ncbi:hypothetical protein [Sulfitobacter sediminilitoris]|uniref:hypothetical protein n=1 Tax=Sulfitobacter sediminilitoris TaxID=2698830 RepID=UPI0036125A4D
MYFQRGAAYFCEDVREFGILLKAAERAVPKIIGGDDDLGISIEILNRCLDKSILRVSTQNSVEEIECRVIGKGQLSNLALAAQTAFDLGVHPEEISLAIREFRLQRRKMEFIEISLDGKNISFLDDCHNATLISFKSALTHIREVITPEIYPIMIVGRIVHIEGQKKSIYTELAKEIVSCNPQAVVLYGPDLSYLSSSLEKSSVRVLASDTPLDVIECLKKIVPEKGFVFLKGSHRGTRIREVSTAIRSYARGGSLTR